jgi:sec-independent protein translocase protein TatC
VAQDKFMRTMNFYDHLDELRTRFVRCLIVFFIGFILCYGLAEPILQMLRAPLFAVMLPEQRKLYFTSLFENFLTHLKIAGYASLFVFSPYYFYQIWGFIEPGLYEKEKRLAIPFVLAASLFFVGGGLFAYFVLFPVGFKYFITYGVSTDIPLLTIDAYYTTCLHLLLLFGLAFELPVLLCLLGYLGIVDAPFLREHRRTAIIGIAVIAALFAPPDAISMLVLGTPLVLFYEGAIWVIQSMALKRKQPQKAESERRNPLEGCSR